MKTYRGSRGGSTADAHVVEVLQDGTTIGVLRHVVKHSPTGFSWSYHGSGPAELARCLLIDYFGSEALCPNCDGIGRDRHGSCVVCWAEGYLLRPVAYQAFKRDFVAQWNDRWEITEDQIDNWLVSFELEYGLALRKDFEEDET